jgi:SAM-dependent methyltransferase
MKIRLDAELVRRELARSRENASDLIESRSVLVNGIPATKPATMVDAETSIKLAGKRDDFVSRGGHKLAGALDSFADVVVEGKRCLDAGASTGGFTDVLLRRGAAHVVAVDVGYGQLAWALRQDERVSILDRTNIAKSFYPLVISEDYASAWRPIFWGSKSVDTIFSSGSFLHDPRPNLEEFSPPPLFIESREIIANKIGLFGVAVAVLTFFALVTRGFIDSGKNGEDVFSISMA